MTTQFHIAFHPFAEGAALHQEGSHRLWVLNHSSAVLWCLIAEHGPGERLIAAYAEHFGISEEQAGADVARALEAFVRDGLLEEEPAVSCQLSAVSDNTKGLGSGLPVTSHQSPVTALWQQTYQTAGVSWQIACSDPAAAETWFTCFNHLKSTSADADLHYHITKDASSWTLTGGGETVSDLADDQVLPWLLTLLFAELCHRQPQHLLLHAAVARRGGRLLLLPGESTFGKSTLAAALAAHGWTLYSDELAPLNPAALVVAPFPLPVGIKSRSLGVLEPYCRELAAQSAWQRADGQVVRYLAPPHIDLADPAAAPTPVDTLIFPRFQPDSPTRLERLNPLTALERLAQTGSSERPLHAIDVQALLTLAGERPCWSLDYGDLDEAVEAVSRICGV